MSSQPLPLQASTATLDQIWFTRCPVPTASGIAHALGWFERAFSEHGIAVGIAQEAPSELLHRYPEDGLPGLAKCPVGTPQR